MTYYWQYTKSRSKCHHGSLWSLTRLRRRTSMVVQWLILRNSNTEKVDLVPDGGIKILDAAWHGQKKKIKNDYYLLKSCLVGARRMLFFMVEQVFLPMEASWLKHNADWKCTVEGKEEVKSRKILHLNFSCLVIKHQYKLYFTLSMDIL